MPKGRSWSYSEERLLVEKYKECTIKELMVIFPGRSQESINNKIKRLKAEKKLLDEKEEDVIKRAYSQR